MFFENKIPLFLPITGIAIVFVIIVIVIISILVKNINKKRYKTMFLNIETVLKKVVAQDPENSNLNKIEYANKKAPRLPYDYILDTKSYKYYVKVVPNFGGYEICVNNSVKWQIRKTFNDESMNFVPEIEELMRLELPKDDETREARKLYIIYPGARSLLRYINECEMEFVHPNTNVYGTNIMTYNDLDENIDFIPREHEVKEKNKNTQLSLKI